MNELEESFVAAEALDFLASNRRLKKVNEHSL